MYNPSYLTTNNQFTIHTTGDGHHRVSLSQLCSMNGSPQTPGLANGVQYAHLLRITHCHIAQRYGTTKTETQKKGLMVMRCCSNNF